MSGHALRFRSRVWAQIKWCAAWAAALFALWLALVVPGVIGPATCFDYAINLGSLPDRPELSAPDDGRRHLVVVQHGIWRTNGSMWRLERTLEAHGYEVLNPSYSSTLDSIEGHAAVLAEAVERRLANGDDRPVAIYAVGHSMGGLVLQEWLARASVAPEACVFLATPHRGAVLCDLRKDLWLFRLIMGDRAALQLSPGDAFQQRAIRNLGDVGNVIGARGDGEGWNRSIPGDDDRTVAVGEARFPEDALDGIRSVDELVVCRTHTRVAIAPEVLVAVLRFLRHRRFDGAR